APDDGRQLGGLVEVEAAGEAETIPQRGGEHAGAGGCADEREAGDVDPDRPGGGALADDDVEAEVLHRRVQDLLDGAGEPVDLIDEEHVAVLEVGQDGGQVPGPL